MMARSGCGRNCGIRLSTGRQTSTAATLLRIPPPAACVGQKRNSPGSGRRDRRSSRRRAALLLPMAQSKSLLLSREKIPLLPGRSRGAWTAAGAPERRAKGRQGQDKRYLYRRTDRDTGHSGSGTAAAGAESIHGGTRAQSRSMAGRTKKSRIAPPGQDGTSLAFRQGRQRHAGQETFSPGSSHQGADDEQFAQIGAEGPLGGGT